ncbi:MAG: hypothetical protein OXI61_04345 [Candidatus Poribacteria bacterium]|nr:hypothetical protein [Candidatus Poribacteria bacterium]
MAPQKQATNRATGRNRHLRDDVQESEIEKAVETLMDATLMARTEDDLIEPKNDAVSFFLNFVSMTVVHLGHIKPEN